MTAYEELFALAEKLKSAARVSESEEVSKPLSDLEEAAQKIGRSFSGSWQGYHSHVYYIDFSPPPPGAHFSQEWGLMDNYLSSLGSRGDWREYDADVVKARIRELAEEPNLDKAHKAAEAASDAFEFAKSEIISILQNELDGREDGFLENLKNEVDELEPLSKFDVEQHLSPKGQIMTRDTIVIGQGTKIPPHMSYVAEVKAIRHAFAICEVASIVATKAASHLERKSRKNKAVERVGTNIFIGHGQSNIWRDLEYFLQNRLELTWSEFNRVSAAGVATTDRLSELLDGAGFAFPIFTAEDEQADETLHARENVIHEAGLFQGRIGFKKAIILLEEGCEEFSNIHGLGQIRFPSGDISAKFEEIRLVLEREGIL